jgi:hypothetical protein
VSSQESHRAQVEARRDRRRRAEARRREAEVREAALRSALARPPASAARARLERLLTETPADLHAERRAEILRVIAERAPRLASEDTLRAVELMAGADWVRAPSAWQPAGKGKDTLFRSLAEHLFARFRMPPVLWTAFSDGDGAPVLARVAVHVGAGGSLHDAVKTGLMPVPLTRRMCHDVLRSPGESSLLAAVRRAQVRAAGGDASLSRTWNRTRAGGRLHNRQDEEFWQTVLDWLCRNPMLPHTEVGPLADYIENRRGESPGFSMKGRSVPAMLRGMREWHRDLAKGGALHGSFRPSGLQPMDIDRSRRVGSGTPIREIWHVREILDSRSLADEGRAMSHCVLSYARWIQSGECSIWTLTLEDDTGHWRRLTIEVRPSLRRIVQARGRFNRLPEERDRIALRAWAGRNNLEISGDSV